MNNIAGKLKQQPQISEYERKLAALPLEIQQFLKTERTGIYFLSSIVIEKDGWTLDASKMAELPRKAYFAVKHYYLDKLERESKARPTSYATVEMADEITQNSLDSRFSMDITPYVVKLLQFLEEYNSKHELDNQKAYTKRVFIAQVMANNRDFDQVEVEKFFNSYYNDGIMSLEQDQRNLTSLVHTTTLDENQMKLRRFNSQCFHYLIFAKKSLK